MCCPARLTRARCRHPCLSVHEDEGVEHGIESLDTIKHLLQRLDRRCVSTAVELHKLGCRALGEIHAASVPPRVGRCECGSPAVSARVAFAVSAARAAVGAARLP